MQSKTKRKTKLILCLRKRISRAHFSLSTVYVLASRVKEGVKV
jgi:hypothetical protein